MKQDKQWRRDIKAAKELGYPRKAIVLLENEKRPNERTKILYDARTGRYGDWPECSPWDFDGDPIVKMSNETAAKILRNLQKNMNSSVARGSGKTIVVLEANMAFCKAIELLENTSD